MVTSYQQATTTTPGRGYADYQAPDPDVLWRQTVNDYEAGRISLAELNKSRENLMGMYSDNKSREDAKNLAEFNSLLQSLGIDAGSQASAVSSAVSEAGRQASSARNASVKAAKGDFRSMVRDIGQQVAGGTQDVLSGAAQMGMDVQPTIEVGRASIAEAGLTEENKARKALADFIAQENIKVANAKAGAAVSAKQQAANDKLAILGTLLNSGADFAMIAKALGGK
jgi:hypothetical protein